MLDTGPLKKSRPALSIGRERVVERADGVGRIRDLEDEVRETVHLLLRDRLVSPEQIDERHAEFLERRPLVEHPAVRLGRGRILAARAVAAPVHRPVVRHAAQALGRHRPLHRMQARILAEEIGAERSRVLHRGAVRVPEVPREAVEVAEDMAARAGRVAVAGARDAS